jgi:hypothetical protein
VKLRPYIFDAIKLVDVLPASLFPTGSRPDGLEFVHFPIVDCAIANDSSVLQVTGCARCTPPSHSFRPSIDCCIATAVSSDPPSLPPITPCQLCHDLVGRLVRGENLYIHCACMINGSGNCFEDCMIYDVFNLTFCRLGWPRSYWHCGSYYVRAVIWPAATRLDALGAVLSRHAHCAHGRSVATDRGSASAGVWE